MRSLHHHHTNHANCRNDFNEIQENYYPKLWKMNSSLNKKRSIDAVSRPILEINFPHTFVAIQWDVHNHALEVRQMYFKLPYIRGHISETEISF